MKLPNPSAVWQHPYVDVFKQLPSMQMEATLEGDATEAMDKVIRKSVYKVKGAISAANYVQIPKIESAPSNGLALTGKYVYIELKSIGSKGFTIHLDLLTDKKSPIRYTLSTLYSEVKSTGSVLRIPMKAMKKWTVVALDMRELLLEHTSNNYCREGYGMLKGMRLCSSMSVKGVYTSDTPYDPTSLPKPLAFYLPSKSTWEKLYDWKWFPGPPEEEDHVVDDGFEPQNTDFTSSSKEDSSRTHIVGHGKRHYQPGSILSENLEFSTSFESEITVQASAISSSSSRPTYLTNQSFEEETARVMPGNLSEILKRNGKGMGPMTEMMSSSSSFVKSSPIKPSKEREEADAVLKEAGISPILSSPLDTTDISLSLESELSVIEKPTSLDPTWPDPILKLNRVIGFTGSYSNCLLWSNDGTSCVFPSVSTVVVLTFPKSTNNTATDAKPNFLKSPAAREKDEFFIDEDISLSKETSELEISGGAAAEAPPSPLNDNDSPPPTQRFLFGHTETVCCLAFNSDSSMLASGQEGKKPVIRMWNYKTGSCAAILTGHASGLSNMDFSSDDVHFCAVGLDDHFRTQIIVWNIKDVYTSRKKAATIVAKQTCEFPISVIHFSPYEANRLVSCGRENVRFWRIKNGHLPGCPVVLNEYARNSLFTDLAFDKLYGAHPATVPHQRPVFVSSASGTVLLVEYDTMELKCVYKLHDGPINCISVNEGFCVTGSSDKYLRVWPMDFSDYFLEAHHEAGVTSIDVSNDGLKILVGTTNGAVGVLDVSTQGYKTLMRSHTKGISSVAIDSTRAEMATSSPDGTIRVWNLESGCQSYEFDIDADECTCIAYHPSRRVLAVGFKSGVTRIFDIISTSVAEEYQQHHGAVSSIKYSADGTHLYTAGLDSQLCMYEVHRGYQPMKMITLDLSLENAAFDLSANGKLLVAIGADKTCASVISCPALKLVRKIEYKRKVMENASVGFRVSPTTFRQVCFTPDGKFLIAIMDNHRVVWFAVESGSVVRSASLVGSSSIDVLSISPNGRYIVTGDSDQSIKLWDYVLNDGNKNQKTRAQSFIGHCGPITNLGFSCDGQTLVSTGDGNAIFVWSFFGDASRSDGLFTDSSVSSIQEEDAEEESKERESLFSEEESALSIISPNEESVVESLKASTTSLFSPDQHNIPTSSNVSSSFAADVVLRTISGTNVTACEEGQIPCNTVQWNPSSGIVACAFEKSVMLQSLKTGQQVLLAEHKGQVIRMARPYKGGDNARVLATIDSTMDKVYLWQEETAELEAELLLPENLSSIDAMLFNTSRSVIIIGRGNFEGECACLLMIFDTSLQSRVLIRRLSGGINTVTSICNINNKAAKSTSSSSISFVIGSCNNFGRGVLHSCVFDTQTSEFTMNNTDHELQLNKKYCAKPTAIVYRHKGGEKVGYLLVADINGDFWIYDYKARSVVANWNINGPHRIRSKVDIRNLEWLGKGSTQFITCSIFGTQKLYRFHLPVEAAAAAAAASTSGREILWSRFNSEESKFKAMQLDGDIISASWKKSAAEGIVMTDGGTMWHVSISDFSQHRFSTSHIKPVAGLKFSKDGQVLGSYDTGNIKFWDASSSSEIVEFDVSSTTVTSLEINNSSSTGNYVAAAAYEDGSLRVFDLDKMQLALKCQAIEDESSSTSFANNLCFIGDDALVMSSSTTGKLSVLRMHSSNHQKSSKSRRDNSSVAATIKSVVVTIPHEFDSVSSIMSSNLYPDMFLAVTSAESRSVKIIVFRGNASEEHRPAIALEGWAVRWHTTKCPVSAMFSPEDESIVIYTSMTREKMPCIELRNYQNRQVSQRIVLDYIPESLLPCVVDNKSFVLCGTYSGQVMSLLDVESNEVVTIPETLDGKPCTLLQTCSTSSALVAATANKIFTFDITLKRI